MQIKRIYKIAILILIIIIIFNFNFIKEQNGGNIISLKKDKTTITVSLKSDRYVDEVKNLINNFNSVNKDNIEIQVMDFPKNGYNNILNMLMTTEKGPDVYMIDKEWLPVFEEKNWLQDLSKYIDSDFIKEFPQWAVDMSKNNKKDGKFYSIPSAELTYRLIYNKDLFRMVGLDVEKPPNTMDEFKLYAKKISDAGIGRNKYGFAFPAGDEQLQINNLIEMPLSYSRVFYYNYNTKAYDLTAYASWLKDIKEMKDNGALYPEANTLESDTAITQFAQGNIGMMFISSKDVYKLLSEANPNLDWQTAMPPVIDNASSGERKLLMKDDMYFGVNSGTKKLSQAIKVWKYFYSKQYVSELYANKIQIPIYEDVKNQNHVNRFSIFNDFSVKQYDKIYSQPPLYQDVWIRSKVYKDIITDDNNIDKILLDYSNQLNRVNNITNK